MTVIHNNYNRYRFGKKRDGSKASEAGAAIVIAIFFIFVILSFAAYLFFSNSVDLARIELQTASDAAALAAAESFDGSNASWARIPEVIGKVLAIHSVTGGSTSNQLAMDAMCIMQDGAIVCPPALDPTDATESAPNNLRVRFRRGFWFPPGDPDDNEEPVFTSLENDPFPGLPGAAVANAIQIELERTSFGSPFRLPWLGDPRGRIKVTSTARAGEVSKSCVAPFAIPISTLLNNSGEFQRDKVCEGDRLFTQSNRYCDDEEGTCEKFPSFEYGPCSEALNSTSIDDWHWNFMGTPGDGKYPAPKFYKGPLPVPTTYGSFNSTNAPKVMPLSPVANPAGTKFGCVTLGKATAIGADFETLAPTPYLFNESKWNSWTNEIDYSPPFYSSYSGSGDKSKGFGVVGLPNGGSEAAIKAEITSLLDPDNALANWSDAASCRIQADIGDPFAILHDGLKDDLFNKYVWERIKGSGPWNKKAIETDIGTIQGQRIRMWVSPNAPVRGQGLCRSKRTQMRTFAWNDPVALNFPRWGYTDSSISPGRVFEARLDSVGTNDVESYSLAEPLLRAALGGSYVHPVFLSPFGYFFNTPTYPDGIINSADNVAGVPAIVDVSAAPDVTDETTVWQIDVPVIADLSTSASSCGHHGGVVSADPGVSSSSDYRIVGFVSVNIFDVDIGANPTDLSGPFEQYLRPQDNWDAANDYRTSISHMPPGNYPPEAYETAGTLPFEAIATPVPTPILLPVPPATPTPTPTLRPTSPGLLPHGPKNWYFPGNENGCNLVRARVTCDSDIIRTSPRRGIRIATIVND